MAFTDLFLSLGHNVPHPDREEYIDNEKYELKHYDWYSMNRLRKLMAAVNMHQKGKPGASDHLEHLFCRYSLMITCFVMAKPTMKRQTGFLWPLTWTPTLPREAMDKSADT
jgi:hypothetical protein